MAKRTLSKRFDQHVSPAASQRMELIACAAELVDVTDFGGKQLVSEQTAYAVLVRLGAEHVFKALQAEVVQPGTYSTAARYTKLPSYNFYVSRDAHYVVQTTRRIDRALQPEREE